MRQTVWRYVNWSVLETAEQIIPLYEIYSKKHLLLETFYLNELFDIHLCIELNIKWGVKITCKLIQIKYSTKQCRQKGTNESTADFMSFGIFNLIEEHWSSQFNHIWQGSTIVDNQPFAWLYLYHFRSCSICS